MKRYVSHKINALLLTVILLTITVLQGCEPNNEPLMKYGFYFNTIVSLTFYNSKDMELFDDCMKKCEKYDNMFSRTIEGSDIYRINHSEGNWTTVSDETIDLISLALEYNEISYGKTDITLAPVSDLWNFTGHERPDPIPTDTEIKNALSHTGYGMIEISENNVRLNDPEAEIDLGFIAKGYVADKLKDYLESQNVESCIINLGGNVQLIGSKPDGSDFVIGIRKPFAGESEYIKEISTSGNSIVTSGIYERYFEEDGIIYHHILDPETGYPVDNNLYSVTVVCESSTMADALSTACLCLGKDEGMKLLDSIPAAYGIFVTDTEEIFISEIPE